MAEHAADQALFLDEKLTPALTATQAGQGNVFFVDAALGLTEPITLVLDNARYQRNAVVMACADQLRITLMFLPSYSPNLNLIERLWKFINRRSLYDRYHPAFADFRTAIEETITQLETTYAADLASQASAALSGIMASR